MGGSTGFGKKPFKRMGPSVQHLQSQFTGLRQRAPSQRAQSAPEAPQAPAAPKPVSYMPRTDQVTLTNQQFGAPRPVAPQPAAPQPVAPSYASTGSSYSLNGHQQQMGSLNQMRPDLNLQNQWHTAGPLSDRDLDDVIQSDRRYNNQTGAWNDAYAPDRNAITMDDPMWGNRWKLAGHGLPQDGTLQWRADGTHLSGPSSGLNPFAPASS